METFDRRGGDRRIADRRSESRGGSDRRTSHRRRHHSRAGHAWRSFKNSMPFLLGLVGTCVVVAFLTGVATRGVEGMYKSWSLALTALDNPAQLNQGQKDELKKMIKGKGDARKAYDGMSAEQKAQAKQTFGSMSDEQKKQLRKTYGN